MNLKALVFVSDKPACPVGRSDTEPNIPSISSHSPHDLSWGISAHLKNIPNGFNRFP
jgi:hypothetical protein